MAGAQRLCSLEQELSVSSHPLRVDRAHVEHLLGFCVVPFELIGPVDPVIGTPSGKHPIGRPKAGAGVDHRGTSHGTADRRRDRRAPLGDREAPVAVKRGQRSKRFLRIAAVVHARSGLEHDDLQAGLREHRRRHGAAGARADDRHVAFLAPRRRDEVTEPHRRPLGLGPSVGALAPHLVADGGAHPGVAAVAEAGDHLEQQQEVAGERDAGALEASQEVLPGVQARVAEPPRKGQPLERLERQPDLPGVARRQVGHIAVQRLRDLDRVASRRASLALRPGRRG